MTLQEKIKNDLIGAHDEVIKMSLRVIVGELQRQKNKLLKDSDVLAILKTLKKSALEVQELRGTEQNQVFIDVLKFYLPEEVSDAEVKEFITTEYPCTKTVSNADVNKLIGIVMKTFPNRIDGKRAREVIMSCFAE